MFKSIKPKKLPISICLFLTFILCVALGHLKSPNDFTSPVNANIDKSSAVDIPIIMYHAVSDVTSIQGDYVISSAEFESDLKYLADNGYTTVFINDIVNYVKGSGKLPEKPIALTFDDGYYNNYLYVYPLVKKYNAKVSISPVAYFSEMYTESGEVSECYSHCTWEELKEMSESGYIELGNHSYNFHTCNGTQNGIGQINGESDDDYRLRITNDLTTAQNMIFENTGVKCSFIAYPFGVYNDNTEKIVKEMGFTAALTCSSGINTLEKGDIEKLYNLKRLIRPHNSGLEYILNKWS